MVFLLTSGENNSLAASMEILSFIRQKGYRGEILHGSLVEIVVRLSALYDRAMTYRWVQIKADAKQMDWAHLFIRIGVPSPARFNAKAICTYT